MTDKKSRLFLLSSELENLDTQYRAAEAVRASRAEAWTLISKESDKAWASYCEASQVCDQLIDKIYKLQETLNLIAYAEKTKPRSEE